MTPVELTLPTADPIEYLARVCNESITVDDVLRGDAEYANAPWDKQADIMHAIERHRRVAVCSGHNVGKTHIAIRSGQWFLNEFPNSIVITTAPKQAQVKDVYWAKWRESWNRAMLGGEMLSMSCALDPDLFPAWKAMGFTSGKADAFAGHHAQYMLIIFDEASGVPPHIYEAAEGMLSGANTYILLIGNGLSRDCDFYKCWLDPSYHNIQISCLEHPNVIHQQQIYRDAVSPTWPEERALAWGRQSNLFKVRVAGEFPSSDDSTLIDMLWLDDAKTNTRDDGEPYCISFGLDPIDEGQNVCALYQLAYRPKSVDVKRIFAVEGMSKDQCVERTRLAVREARARYAKICPIRLAYDAVGAGSWFSDVELPIEIHPYKGSWEADNNEEFHNLNAETWWNLRILFEDSYNHEGQNVCLEVDDEDAYYQLSERKYQTNEQSGKIQMEPKRQMFRPCDNADAIGIGHWGSQTGSWEEYEDQEGLLTA